MTSLHPNSIPDHTTNLEPMPSKETRSSVPEVSSRVLPWLAKMAYLLLGNLVLPWHFRQISVQGQEHLPKSGAVILAPMHRSRWDALIVPYAAGRRVTGRDIHFMVSINEIKGVQGWFIRRMGGFPVNSDQPGRLRALASSIHHSVDLLCQRKMMVVFPEGNIFRSEQLQPLKTGIAHMALQAAQTKDLGEVHIVPMGLAYDQPYPKQGSSVAVQIAPPLSTRNYAHLSSKQAVKAITEDLTQALLSLDPKMDLPPQNG
ncbi:MAG: lysophospholipid acyltransferase family protein [Prochlorotrichaceae cyanobacterium]